MHREKGSALVIIILVVFVLTMVGIAGVLFMTMEDRLSGNDKLTKEALYVAEIGLRAGESVVKTKCASGSDGVTSMLTGSPTYQPPGAGYVAYSAGTAYQNVVVASPGSPDTVTYSIFVRNNIDDSVGSSATKDEDSRINIVALATVTDASGRGISKILEEQMFVGGAGGGERLEKGGNFGGTGGAGIGGSGALPP
jgi:Tfp pilus assembly protein PilX